MTEAGRTVAPLISVILPVYNGGPWLRASIQSILDQTERDFELIIINDGSTDDSEAVIRSFTDPRIRAISQQNQGLAATLNIGLQLACGKWIARQDQDDVSHPERFATQLAYLTRHPEVGLLGTWATVVDNSGKPTAALEHPITDASIRFALLFDSPFVHTSIMGPRDVFMASSGYSTDRAVFEDFELWSRMVAQTRAANLPLHLVHYRAVDTGLSRVVSDRQERVLEQRRRNMRTAFPQVPDELIASLAEYGLRNAQIPAAHFRSVCSLLSGFIRQLDLPSDEERALMKRMRGGMLGYRLLAHRNFFSRAADRLLKEALLLWSNLTPSAR